MRAGLFRLTCFLLTSLVLAGTMIGCQSAIPSPTLTSTFTRSPTSTFTPTSTLSPTLTATSTPTPTSTASLTPSETPSYTPTTTQTGMPAPFGNPVTLQINNNTDKEIRILLESIEQPGSVYEFFLQAGEKLSFKIVTGKYKRTTWACGGVSSTGTMEIKRNFMLNFTPCG